MLRESQINQVWQNLLAAETRSLYFADLARMYTLRKQWITGISFFLSSGAAATLIAKFPALIPLILATVVAILNAYSMAVTLDRSIQTMVKLNCAWSDIATAYERLWNHAYEDGAEHELNEIIGSEKGPAEIAVRDAPNDERRLTKWQDRVFALRQLTTQ